MTLFLLLVFDIVIATNKYLTFFPKHLLYPRVEILSDLKNELGNDRFDRERAELLPSNTWVPYGLTAVSGQNPFYPKPSAMLLSIANNSYPNLVGRFVDINLESPLLDTFNVKFILVLNRHKEKTFPDASGQPFKKFNQEKFSEYKNYQTVRVLRNNTNLGLAWFSKNVICQTDEAKTAKIISSQEYSPKNLVVINCQGNNINNATIGSIQVHKDSSNSIELEVETKTSNYLTISKAYYPGWKAFLDGAKQPLYTSNIALMSVFIPSGRHIVSLKYEPLSFWSGVLISATTLVSWCGWLLFKFLTGKKSKN